MADIACTRCGEPWDWDCLHDEVTHRFPHKPWMITTEPNPKTVYDRLDSSGLWYSHEEYQKIYRQVKDDFFRRGCVALTAYTDGECEPTEYGKRISEISYIAREIMGDDIDGYVSAMEDAEQMGLF